MKALEQWVSVNQVNDEDILILLNLGKKTIKELNSTLNLSGTVVENLIKGQRAYLIFLEVNDELYRFYFEFIKTISLLEKEQNHLKKFELFNKSIPLHNNIFHILENIDKQIHLKNVSLQ